MGILDDAAKDVGQMSEDEIRKEFLALAQAREKRKVKQAEYNAKPENKAKREAYSKAYRDKDPEAFKAKRKAYMTRPDVKAKHKAYMKDRNDKRKAILARAKELGLDKQPEVQKAIAEAKAKAVAAATAPPEQPQASA